MWYNKLIIPLVQRALNLLYNPFAWVYDFVSQIVSFGHWRTWVTSCLPYINGDYILEIGFGTGTLQLALNQDKPQLNVFGIDASWKMAKITQKKLNSNGINARICYGYAQFTPFPPSFFDQIIITFPANYFLDPHTLSEIFRILKPGGNCTTLLHVEFVGNNPPAYFLRHLYRITGQSDSTPQNMRYLKEYLKSYQFNVKMYTINENYWRLNYIVMEKCLPT